MNCRYCNNTATRFPANPYNGKLVNVCEWHYSKWKPEQAKDVFGWKRCALCKTRSKRRIRHHVSYFPEIVIAVCNSCHKRIHSGLLSKYMPPEGDCEEFYKE